MRGVALAAVMVVAGLTVACSSGPNPTAAITRGAITVPNVVGESVSAAEGQLEQLLVAASASQQVGGPSAQTFGNKVAQQDPAPGTKVVRRSTVTLTQKCVSGCAGS
jgi:hypothetical protein